MATKPKPKKAVVPPSEDAIKAAVERLTAGYRLGQQLNQRTAPNDATLKRDGANYPCGTVYSNRQKMRQLADMVTEEDWAELMDLRLRTTGQPLSWTHLTILASVPRDRLMQEARATAKQGLSARRLRCRLQLAARKMSRRPGTGKKITLPASIPDGWQQLNVNLDIVKKRVAALRTLLAGQPELAGLLDKLVALDVAVAAIRDPKEFDYLLSVSG